MLCQYNMKLYACIPHPKLLLYWLPAFSVGNRVDDPLQKVVACKNPATLLLEGGMYAGGGLWRGWPSDTGSHTS